MQPNNTASWTNFNTASTENEVSKTLQELAPKVSESFTDRVLSQKHMPCYVKELPKRKKLLGKKVKVFIEYLDVQFIFTDSVEPPSPNWGPVENGSKIRFYVGDMKEFVFPEKLDENTRTHRLELKDVNVVLDPVYLQDDGRVPPAVFLSLTELYSYDPKESTVSYYPGYANCLMYVDGDNQRRTAKAAIVGYTVSAKPLPNIR